MPDKELSTGEKLEVIQAFVKEAWCADREAELITESITFDSYILLTDSKRGARQIAFRSKPEQ